MTLTLAPVRHGDAPARFHYVTELGRTDYGDVAEILGKVNADTVGRELTALGIEWGQWRERTWLCGVVAFVVDAYHPGTVPYLAELARRLEAYPVLDDDAWTEAEWQAGVCPSCGGYGLPEGYGTGDVCESCGHVRD